MERIFIVSVIEEDIPEQFKDDLEGHIRGAIGNLLGLDADVGFSVEAAGEAEGTETISSSSGLRKPREGNQGQ